MNIILVKDYEEMSQKAAELFKQQLVSKPDSILGLATGSSPVGTYQNLIKMCENKEISFENVRSYNLDEYCGIDKNHSQSYYTFMHENLFNHVNIKEENINIPASGSDMMTLCNEYNTKLNSVSIDLQLLGIGGNGHVGFNEPGTSFDQETFVVELAEQTRLDNQRFFNSLDEVPTHAITMGIKNIMNAKSILMLISGAGKQDAVYKLLKGDVTTSFPASVLKNHPNVTVIIDEAAYKLVK